VSSIFDLDLSPRTAVCVDRSLSIQDDTTPTVVIASPWEHCTIRARRSSRKVPFSKRPHEQLGRTSLHIAILVQLQSISFLAFTSLTVAHRQYIIHVQNSKATRNTGFTNHSYAGR